MSKIDRKYYGMTVLIPIGKSSHLRQPLAANLQKLSNRCFLTSKSIEKSIFRKKSVLLHSNTVRTDVAELDISKSVFSLWLQNDSR